MGYLLCQSTWPSPNGQAIRLIMFFAAKNEETLYSQSTKLRPGDDCGSYNELLIAKCKLKLKKAGKTIRSLRLHLNEIPL